MNSSELKVAIIQIAPMVLDKTATWKKLEERIDEAVSQGVDLITWGETLIPCYPQWISPSGGAKFNNKDQKKVYAKYWKNALPANDPIIDNLAELSRVHDVTFMGGIAEQSSGSIYCTLLTVAQKGSLISKHRKIKPTFEERLVWADGDSKGLRVFDSKIGPIGNLNCWENWIPYTRAYLHDLGEMVHVAVWPGSDKLTSNISKFMALEGRSWIISASGLIRGEDYSHLTKDEFPFLDTMLDRDVWQNGGSVIVNPKGEEVTKPLLGKEGILYADLDQQIVIEERHNFDYSGHYSRKDIFDLTVK